jgi:patatin-like phospholipase/acyl hydrolase
MTGNRTRNLAALGMSTFPVDVCMWLTALDGGGIRGVVQLLILDHIMATICNEYKLQSIPRPCEYFDLIGGTSTGGYVHSRHLELY